jgi:hypothetical protein
MNEAEINVLRSLVTARKLGPYISHIRFPYYKNLEPGTRIDFQFPITALVGVNGTNKSSVLRAIQGSPENENLGVYWFSTSTDPIEEAGGNRNAFVYGYHHAGAKKTVEVLKTRVKKEEDPDYWEPSRAIASYGMEKFDGGSSGNKNKTRWDTIVKPVVYIDFRQTISAFDRCFYYGSERTPTTRERKELLRKRSPYLKAAINTDAASYSYYGERIVDSENRLLTEEERNAVSKILGREYLEIRWIRHNFFNVRGATCLMKAGDLSYTEAFAGSGEFAVVRLVVDLINAQKSSLVLLDEPEVSLHPGAQERLMSFLFGRVKSHKYQIVIATHSPGMIRWLPPEAIKALIVDPTTGRIRLPSQATAAEEAFFYLGEPIPGRITVIVEDELAKHVVIKALRVGGEAFFSRFDVKYFPGGSQTLWSHYLPIFSAEQRKDVLVMLDGDQKPPSAMPDPATVPAADSEKLQQTLTDTAGVKIKFGVDASAGKANAEQIDQAVRQLVGWARKHVASLPGDNPETFVWTNMKKDDESAAFESLPDAKKRFDDLARQELGRAPYEPLTSQEILGTQLRRLATIPDGLPALQDLHQRLATAAAAS